MGGLGKRDVVHEFTDVTVTSRGEKNQGCMTGNCFVWFSLSREA